MLDVLRLKPLIGRNFTPDEDKPGGAKVVLLSYGLWQRVFRGDRNLLGRILKLDDQAYTVIGVLPREAVFPDRTELWTPLQSDPSRYSGYYVNGVGRLKPGVSIEQARADLLRIHKAMVPQHSLNEITSPILIPLRDRYLGDFKTVSRVLLGAVGVVLLIVCVNIAALMMVRGAFRSRGIAIRTALGASRVRIVAQLFTENLVLAAAGGIFGVALGAVCLRFMISMMSENLPQWISFSLDVRFVIFCVAILGAAALLFGLAPIFQVLRVDIRGSLQDSAARTTSARGQRGMLGALVVCEIGLALVLCISAGLLVQAFRKVIQVDPGFRPENVKVAATPGYREAIGMTLLDGRTFDQQDGKPDAPITVMVNETFVKHFWGTGSPVGKRIRPGGGKDWYQVIGLLRDEKHFGPDREVMPSVFLPYSTAILTSDRNDARALQQMFLILRSSVDPEMLVGTSRELVRKLDPNVPIYDVQTMTERLGRFLWARRAYSWLFGVFAMIATLLAAAGVYGIVSYAVSQRTQEIGIRMALGALPGQVLGLVLRSGMTLVSIGVAAGLAGAFWVTGLLRKLLFGVSSHDPVIYATVVLGVLCVGLLANFVPARRAASVDPIRALHFE